MRVHRAGEGLPTLEAALSRCLTVAELRKLAKLTPEKVPTRKADLVQLVIGYLAGDGLRAVWEGLDEVQQAAVAEVVHSRSTRFPVDLFRAKYGRTPTWGSAGRSRYDRDPSPLCFFFYGDGIMPDDLKARLKAFVRPPVAPGIRTLDGLPRVYERPYESWNAKSKRTETGTEPIPLVVRETEVTAQRELLTMLRLVDSGKIAVSDRTRRPSASTVVEITAALEGGDFYPFEPPKDRWDDENAGPMRAFAWPMLIQAGGLAQRSGSKLRLSRAGRKALSEPPEQVLASLWAKWLDTRLLDELSRVECVKGQTGKGKRGLTAVSSRREAIASVLGACPVQRWIEADELLRFAQASGDDFKVTRDPWGLYLCEPQYGSLGYAGAEGVLEKRYLLCVLFEYAATLGLVDVAFIPPGGARQDYVNLWGADDLLYFSRYDGLLFFRVNALGAYCLGTAGGYRSAPVEVRPVLRVLPNLEIAAIGGDLEQADRLALDAYAVGTSDLVWRIEAEKLLAAAEAGRSLDEVREFLEARSAAPLPDTVARLIDDVAGRCGRVQDRGLARLVECADPELAALIAHDRRAQKHCMLAGERHLVVPASSESAFRRALRTLGYLLTDRGAQVERTERRRQPRGRSRK